MAIGYFNPRPAGGSMGGAVNPRDRYAFDPKTVSAQADNLPPWVIPAIAGAGIGATSLGLWAMHRASGTPYVPGSYSSPNVPFNVGYGNGLGTPPQVAPTSTAMVPTQMGVAPTGTGITVQGPATGGYQTAELLNTAEGQAVAQRMAQARAGMNPTLGSGQLGLNAAPQASLSSGPLGLNSGQLALPQAPPASLGAADAQLALGAAPTATPSYGSGFTMGEAGPVSSASRPTVTVAELGRAPASTALEPYYGGPGVTSGGATGGGVYGTAADAAAAEAAGVGKSGFWQGLKSNAFLKSPAVDATTAGLEAAPTLTGAAKYLDYGKMGLKGLGKGLGGLAISTAGNSLADQLPVDSNARPGIRAMSNVGGAMFALPAIGGGLAATAAVPGVGAAEAVSRTSAGNEFINAQRNASTNPLANAATFANPVSMLMNLGFKVKDVINGENGGDGRINLGNRTNDTVFDVLGGGNNNSAQAAAPVLTPEERLARTSPDSLLKIASDYGLSDAMKQKLVKNYNQAMVMAKASGGAVPLAVDKDGKLSDGSDPKDYPGAKQMPDAQGNKQWVTTNPADVQQHVFQQATQLIPSLGHAQEQEDDFFRKQAVMQSQLEAAMPTLYDAPSWQGDPYAKQLAMTEARAIPSRYVQAQALQAQQAYDNQIAQAMQQQQLAAQYPDLFGKKSNSGQPATLDAAMQNG